MVCKRRLCFEEVSLTLIVEAEQESEGQLRTDALGAFDSIRDSGCRVYYWPLALREPSLIPA
jgi:hypothetical protein